MNIGEQIVSSYLKHIKGCDFVQTNVYTVDSQGEIDVLGIDLAKQKVYLCEVAIHLTTGLMYVDKGNKTSNVQKLTDKFSRDIAYADRFFPNHEKHYTLWSPVVKGGGRRAPHNDQMKHLDEIAANIRASHGVQIEFVVNQRFRTCLDEMKTYAASVTAELKCPILRMYQIDAYLDDHLDKLSTASAIAGEPSGNALA